MGGCIATTQVCDFNSDCMAGDLSDETSCSSYPARCTFKKGFCHYGNDYDDQFDWSIATAGTASFGTGPSIDHTTLTDKGLVTVKIVKLKTILIISTKFQSDNHACNGIQFVDYLCSYES